MDEDKQKDQTAVDAAPVVGVQQAEVETTTASPPGNFQPDSRFWAIIFTLAVMSLMPALENTVVTTALPHIAAELDLRENYVWVTNVFFLTG